MKIIKNYILFLATLTVLFSACKEEEVIDNTLRVAFKEFNGSIGAADESVTVTVISSRAADQDLDLTIGVSGACNAVLDDYIFTDALGNVLDRAGEVALNLTIPAGTTSTSFTVKTAVNAFPVATEELEFALVAVENAELNDSHLLFEVLIGSGSGFFASSYSNDFENCGNQGVPADFTLFNEGAKEDRSFYCQNLNDNTSLIANAFGGTAGAVDAWLVTKKKFDFSNATKAVFTMDVISDFSGSGQLEFLWSNDYCGSGSPLEGASWTNLSSLEAKLPTGGSDTLMTISANNTEIIGESGYFAFRLVGATNASSISYSIDNFNLKEPVIDVPVDEPAVVLLDESFDTACAADGLPANWTSFSVSSDNNWACSGSNRGFSGEEGDYAVEMNNFNSPDGAAAEDWLITPLVDVVEGAQLSFNSVVRYSGTTVTILTSTDYVPGNNPNDYTWNVFTAATDAVDTDDTSFDYVASGDIALDGFSGNTYFAFKYVSVGAASGESAVLRIDNVLIATEGNTGTTGSSFSTDFESCTEDFATPAGFSEEFLTAKEDRGWGCRQFGLEDSRAVQASAFGGVEGEDNSWLIIDQSFDFTGLAAVNFQMQMYSNFDGPGQVIAQYSTDYSGSGSPADATWIALADVNNAMPAAGSQTWTPINEDVTALGGKTVYIAFQFTGANSAASSSWAIDNLAINDPNAFSGSGGGNGGGSGGGNGSAITQFDTDFEGCTADFTTPTGFFEEFLTAKEDRGWGCRQFGLDDSRAVQASGFGGAEGEDHSWLIFEDQFDFTGETSVNILFSMFSNFGGPGQVIMKYSTDYSGNGKPDVATWTAISAVNSAMPAAGTQTWTEINEDVSSLGGKTVYLAFEFVGANNSASSSWAIDNLAINNPTAFN